MPASRVRRPGGGPAAASPRAAALAAALVCLAGGAHTARAQLLFDLAPNVVAGVTNNAGNASTPVLRARDEFFGLAVAARLRYDAARSAHALAYRAGYTRFIGGEGADTFSNDLTVSSSFTLSARLTLALGGGVTLSRTSGVDPRDLTTVTPQASMSGTRMFLATTARQSLAYLPNARRAYTETLSAGQVHYLSAPVPATGAGPAAMTSLPTTTVINAGARASFAQARDVFFGDAQLGDSFISGGDELPDSAFSRGHVFLGQLAAGWRRDLNAVWSAAVQAGPTIVFKWGGPGVIAPGGSIAVNYQQSPWFATVTASQAPAPNLFLGEATINDQLLGRLALPLNRRETFFVTATGGYIYARVANGDLQVTRAYDQLTGGLACAWRPLQLPLFASLSYTVVDQRGSSGAGREIPDLARQTVMLNAGGLFAWGPGTPPLFGGGP